MRVPDQTNPDYLLVDFHTHTIYSTDSLTSPGKLIATARRKGIDRVVVTDHNEIEGAFIARDIDPETIIVGCEIDTTEGEILAVFITEAIPPYLPPQEVITRLREQNAFISISHPFDPTRKGRWRVEALLEILPYIDAIETFNARCMLLQSKWGVKYRCRLVQGMCILLDDGINDRVMNYAQVVLLGGAGWYRAGVWCVRMHVH